MVDLFLFLLVWETRASNTSFAKGKLTGDVKELVNELLNSSEFACELLIKFPFPAPNKNAEKDTIICANSAFFIVF